MRDMFRKMLGGIKPCSKGLEVVKRGIALWILRGVDFEETSFASVNVNIRTTVHIEAHNAPNVIGTLASSEYCTSVA